MQQSFFVTYGALISASAVILANLFSIWFAVRNTRKQVNQSIVHFDSQFALNRKFETLRLLMDFEKRISEAQKCFHRLSRSGALKSSESERLLEIDGDYAKARELINIYEVLAIGVKELTLDEVQIKEYWRSDYVRTWLRVQHMVKPQREIRRTPKLYINFQELSEKWLNEEDTQWFLEYMSASPTVAAAGTI